MGHGRKSATGKRMVGLEEKKSVIEKKNESDLTAWKFGKNADGIPMYALARNAQKGRGLQTEEGKMLADAMEEYLKGKSYTEGDIFRGIDVTESQLQEIKKGNIPQDGALASWTNDFSIGAEFARANANRNNTRPLLYVMEGGTKNGAFIEDKWGDYSKELSGWDVQLRKMPSSVKRRENEVMVSKNSVTVPLNDVYNVSEITVVHIKEK